MLIYTYRCNSIDAKIIFSKIYPYILGKYNHKSSKTAINMKSYLLSFRYSCQLFNRIAYSMRIIRE